ncbi:MAG: AAA family ATPase [Myxococcales bacterium]
MRSRRRGHPSARKAFQFVDFAELRGRTFPKPVWLVRGLLPDQAVAAIAGEPKTTKTWCALDEAVALATATPAFGEFEVTERKAVACFMVEDSDRSVAARVRALIAGRNLPPDAVDGWLFAVPREPLNLQDDNQVAELIVACRSLPRPIGLLVLDCLRDLHLAEENDSGAMAHVMAQLRALRDVLGCAVLFVHHAAKASENTRDRRPGQRMRGSSAIHGALDAGLYLNDLDTDGSSYWLNKNVAAEIKAARGAGCFSLRLDVRDDAEDEAAWAGWTVEHQDDETRAAQESEKQAQREAERRAADAAKQARRDADLEAALTKVLASLGSEPLSAAKIRAKVNIGQPKVDAALEAARARGLAEHLNSGDKAQRGWVRRGFAPLPTASTQCEARCEGTLHRTDPLLPVGEGGAKRYEAPPATVGASHQNPTAAAIRAAVAAGDDERLEALSGIPVPAIQEKPLQDRLEAILRGSP